jgi:hypothetical protein
LEDSLAVRGNRSNGFAIGVVEGRADEQLKDTAGFIDEGRYTWCDMPECCRAEEASHAPQR